ncbi:MAG: hypothetical protein ACI9Y7_000764 [Dokdonia sp.]|jgi:hypothetical protein
MEQTKTTKDILIEAVDFENSKMSHMSTSDRVVASREAKRLILAINEIYKESKEPELMDMMKRLTEKKRKIEKRLKGRPDTA